MYVICVCAILLAYTEELFFLNFGFYLVCEILLLYSFNS